MNQPTHKVTLVESPEGWAVWCDDMPNCASQGGTREEALENIRSAIHECQEAQAVIQARFQRRVFLELVEA